ncbi:MAG: hypothetical protein LBL18_04560 [Bacteroidales bacterium]|jgi:hypothetical protein|nr:hypothetical protein [Bacteroidales bacterium]
MAIGKDLKVNGCIKKIKKYGMERVATANASDRKGYTNRLSAHFFVEFRSMLFFHLKSLL